MKKFGSSIGWLFILCLLLLSLTFVDFLALADIHQDYVSSKVLTAENINISDQLPDWTSAHMEWTFIRISFFVKAVVLVVIFVLLFRLTKRLNL